MKTLLILLLTAAAAFVAWFSQHSMPKHSKKERRAVFALTALGWILAVFLVFFPEAPGPNVWIEVIYKPLGIWLQTYRESLP